MAVSKMVSGMLAGVALLAVAGCNRQAPSPAANAANETQVQQTSVDEPTIERLDPGLDAVIAAGTKLEKVASGFVFTEGPMWRDGRLWFSDLRGNTVYAVTPDGKKDVLIKEAGGYPDMPIGTNLGPNAMVPDKDGSVLLVQQGGRKISRLGPDLVPKPILAEYEGKRLNSPNDLVYAPDGALWFTDPPYGLPKEDEDPAKELRFNGVFRYAGGKLTAAVTDLTRPNGIAISADGKTLYINNFGPEMKLMAYDVAADGKTSNGRALVTYTGNEGPGGPDGVKVDSAGNLWATGPGGIRIITPAGKILGLIKMPKQTANLAFGEGGDVVYITSFDTIYKIKSKIKGNMPLYYKK